MNENKIALSKFVAGFATCVVIILFLYRSVIEGYMLDKLIKYQVSDIETSLQLLSSAIYHQDEQHVKEWASLTSEKRSIEKVYVLSLDHTVFASHRIAFEGEPLFDVDNEVFKLFEKNTINQTKPILREQRLHLMSVLHNVTTREVSHFVYVERDFAKELYVLRVSILLFLLFITAPILYSIFYIYRHNKRLIGIELSQIEQTLVQYHDGDSSIRLDESRVNAFLRLKLLLNDFFELMLHRKACSERERMVNELIVTNVVDAIIMANRQGIIINVNDNAVTLFGYNDESELEGLSILRLIPAEYHQQHIDAMGKYKNKNEKIDLNQTMHRILNKLRNISGVRKSGEVFPAEIVVTESKMGGELTFTAFIRDVSNEVEYQHKIEKLAYYDALTGLLNLNGLSHHFSKVTVNTPYHISLIELTAIKNINDSYGYDYGDRFITEFCQRIRSLNFENYLVCRVFNGRFILLTTSHARVVVKSLKAVVAKPIEFEKLSIIPKFCRVMGQVANEVELGEFINQANLAIRQALEKGPGAIINLDNQYIADLKYTAMLCQSLESAILSEELYFVFQPKYASQSLEMSSAEALIRWQKDGKLISPAIFIPLAERSHLMPLIDSYVIRGVCRQIRTWLDNGNKVVPISINLSARYLFQKSTISYIFENLGEFDVPPKLLEIEVTEYGLIHDFKKASIQMARLEKSGVSIAIDDYGTGNANLETVLSLPIKHLKIDQSFIKLGMKTEKGKIVLENIISLANALEVKTTAEGVETKEQLTYLKVAKCDYLQGYLLSKPLEASDFEKLIT